MTNREKLIEAFTIAMPDVLVSVQDAQYANGDWDSLVHMVLCSSIEEKFDIMLEIEEIAEISSLDEAIRILKKHNIDV